MKKYFLIYRFFFVFLHFVLLKNINNKQYEENPINNCYYGSYRNRLSEQKGTRFRREP